LPQQRVLPNPNMAAIIAITRNIIVQPDIMQAFN